MWEKHIPSITLQIYSKKVVTGIKQSKPNFNNKNCQFRIYILIKILSSSVLKQVKDEQFKSGKIKLNISSKSYNRP